MKVGEGISSDQKISHGTTKYVLRKAAEKKLPEEWYKRKKKGFPVPINGITNNARKIYTVLVFLVWYKRYFIDEVAGN